MEKKARADGDKAVSTHSRPKAAEPPFGIGRRVNQFQHTAARRRLRKWRINMRQKKKVSTHSRPKAAERI